MQWPKAQKSTVHYDAPKLLETKCASCHNLDMPPKTSDDERAPPLYTVTVHLKDWIKSETDTENRAKFVAFKGNGRVDSGAEVI